MPTLVKSVRATPPKPKPGIMNITPYVAGKSKIAGKVKKLMKLSSNESSFGPSPKAIKAYTDHAAVLNRYPDSSVEKLREAIADVYDLDASRIVCGAGSDELIGLITHAYAGVGDEVLYSEHGFLMYKIYAQGNGAKPITAPEKDMTADVRAILARVTSKTRIVFLANPNNPTGTYLPASELKRLRNRLPGNVILVIDGAYAEYADHPDYSAGRELVDAGENTIMLRTFSKIYGLSSLRIGWGYFPKAIADVMNRIRGPFNVSGVAIDTAVAAVQDTVYTAKIKNHTSEARAWVSDELSRIGLIVYPSLANFVLVEFPLKEKTAAEANAFLMEHGIIPREVANYGLPECLRITIGNDEENKAVVSALTEFMTRDD